MLSSKRRLLLSVATGMSLTGLAACSGSEPDPAMVENVTAESPAPVTAETPVAEAPPPAPEPTVDANASVELPPEEAAAPDEQMLDDASATGMTARAARGEDEAAPVGNATDE